MNEGQPLISFFFCFEVSGCVLSSGYWFSKGQILPWRMKGTDRCPALQNLIKSLKTPADDLKHKDKFINQAKKNPCTLKLYINMRIKLRVGGHDLRGLDRGERWGQENDMFSHWFQLVYIFPFPSYGRKGALYGAHSSTGYLEPPLSLSEAPPLLSVTPLIAWLLPNSTFLVAARYAEAFPNLKK